MEHIAIDLGAKESQVCVRSEGGEIVEERRIATRPQTLRRYLEGRAKSRVIVETGAEAFWVAEIARVSGHEVRVVPSMLAPSLGVGQRRLKSDQRDARVLSESSCRMDLPSVHIPAVETRRMKSRLTMREALVRSRTSLVNVVKAYLRTIGERAPMRYGEKWIPQLREKLAHAAQHVKPLLEVLEALDCSIEEFDQELKELSKGNELAERLQTAPGVGVVTALRYLATLDVASRFANGAAVGSYLGLVPSEHSSGQSRCKGAITKAGSASMRGLLVQAAWAALRSRHHRNDPMLCWAREVAGRRGKKVAVVALARKMAGILFAMWRDATSYNAQHAALAAQSEHSAPPRRLAPSKGPRRPLRLVPAAR
jgi:transposase